LTRQDKFIFGITKMNLKVRCRQVTILPCRNFPLRLIRVNLFDGFFSERELIKDLPAIIQAVQKLQHPHCPTLQGINPRMKVFSYFVI